MSCIIIVILSMTAYLIYYVFKQLEKNDEEREEGYHGAIYRYRYTKELSPFSHPRTPFEEGWNLGIETVKEVTEGIG